MEKFCTVFETSTSQVLIQKEVNEEGKFANRITWEPPGEGLTVSVTIPYRDMEYRDSHFDDFQQNDAEKFSKMTIEEMLQ